VAMTSRLLLTTLLLALAACAYNPPKDANSPYYKVPVGSTLILMRPIEIPFNEVSVRLVNAGDPPKTIHPYHYDTTCELEMWSKKPVTRTVTPDVFSIIKVTDDVDYVQREPVKLAEVYFGIGFGFGGGFSDGPGWEVHRASLYLRSKDNPDVFRVECEYQDTAGEGIPLSINTIRWALGGDFELRMAEPAPATSTQAR